jgi:hypothetical protein
MSKITKSRKRKINTVWYGKNPRKNFFPEKKKFGEKFPCAFSSVVNSVEKNVKNYKKLEKN